MGDRRTENSGADARGTRPSRTYAISAREDAGVVVLTLEGEFDLAAVPAVRERVDAAAGQDARAVVLDMALVPFLDSSALRELLRGDAALRAEGSALVVAGLQPAVTRLLELTRTTDILTLAPSVEQALTQLGARP